MPIGLIVTLAQWLIQEVSGSGPIMNTIAQALTNQTKVKNTRLQSVISKITRLADQILYELERSNSLHTPSTQSEITFEKVKQIASQKFRQEIYNIQRDIDAIQTGGDSELQRAGTESAGEKIGTHANRQSDYDKAQTKVDNYNQTINNGAKEYNKFLNKRATAASNSIQWINNTDQQKATDAITNNNSKGDTTNGLQATK